MTIFGKKFDRGVTRFANKIKHTDFHKIGQKIGHGIHKTLGVASKVVNIADNVADKVANISGKLTMIPGIGGYAMAVNLAANQARMYTKGAKLGLGALGRLTDSGVQKAGEINQIKNKGVEGLEKKVGEVKNYGDAIGRAKTAIVKSGFNTDVVGAQMRNVAKANPLANK